MCQEEPALPWGYKSLSQNQLLNQSNIGKSDMREVCTKAAPKTYSKRVELHLDGDT